MKYAILFPFVLIICFSCNADQKTAWETYLTDSTLENANRVSAIKYSQASKDIDKDIARLTSHNVALDKGGILLSMRLLNSSESGLRGSGVSIVNESFSHAIHVNPSLYLSSLEETGSKRCLGVDAVGVSFVDRLDERIDELKRRLKSIQSAKSTNKFVNICSKELYENISSYEQLINIEKKTSFELKKYSFKKIRKNEKWLVSIFESAVKTEKVLFNEASEPLITWVDDNTLLINVNCGSPCTAYSFYKLDSGEEFHSQDVIAYNREFITLFEESDVSIRRLFDSKVINKLKLDLSPVSVPISGIIKAEIESGILKLKYLKGEGYDEVELCFNINENKSCS